MNYPEIDARGRSCPEPVILTKRGIDKAPEGIIVLVDNTTARDNISRFGKNAGYTVTIEEDGSDYKMILCK